MNQKTRITKSAGLAFVGTLLSFFAFYSLEQFIGVPTSGNLWLIAIFSLLFLIVYSLEVVLMDSFLFIALVVLIQGMIPFIIFSNFVYPDTSLFIVGGTLVFALLLLIGAYSAFRLKENSIRIKFITIAKRAVPKASVGLIIFLLLTVYFNFFFLDQFSTDIGYNLFVSTLNSSEGAFQVWFPGTRFDMAMDDVIQTMSETQLNRSRFELLQEGTNLTELPLSTQQQFFGQVKSRVVDQLEQYLGPIDLDQTFQDYIFTALIDYLNQLSVLAKLILEATITILAFFAMKGLAFFIYIPAEILGFLVYKALVIFNFAHIELEGESREVIVF